MEWLQELQHQSQGVSLERGDYLIARRISRIFQLQRKVLSLDGAAPSLGVPRTIPSFDVSNDVGEITASVLAAEGPLIVPIRCAVWV